MSTLSAKPPTDGAWIECYISHIEYLLRINPDKTVYNSIFHTASEPEITMRQYLERLFKNLYASRLAYVYALVYLERIVSEENAAAWRLSPLNAHRLVFTAMIVAAKMLDEKHYTNTYYARVGGVSLPELMQLEVGLLEMMDFSGYVSKEAVQEYLEWMECLSTAEAVPRNGVAWCKSLEMEQLFREVEAECDADERAALCALPMPSSHPVDGTALDDLLGSPRDALEDMVMSPETPPQVLPGEDIVPHSTERHDGRVVGVTIQAERASVSLIITPFGMDDDALGNHHNHLDYVRESSFQSDGTAAPLSSNSSFSSLSMGIAAASAPFLPAMQRARMMGLPPMGIATRQAKRRATMMEQQEQGGTAGSGWVAPIFQ